MKTNVAGSAASAHGRSNTATIFSMLRVVILIFFSLFSACGDMGALYSSGGMYQVRTLVNGNSLENCSIIRSDDKIRPYFATSVMNDPDLTGLLVYLQDYNGEIVGEKVQYVLQSHTGDELEVGQEEIIEETPENSYDVDDKITDSDLENEEGDGAAKEKTDTEYTGKVIVVASFDQDLPYFPLPEGLEPGSYSLVFEALGSRGVLSRTGTDIFYLGSIEFNLKDISLYLPGLSGSQLILPGTMVMVEAGLDFDKELDPYVIWYRGKTVISEGKITEGAGNLFWKAPEQAGFYSLRVEAFPFRPQRSFTGFSREITLPVSSKAVDTGFFFDAGPKYIPQSLLANGAAYLEQVQLAAALGDTETAIVASAAIAASAYPSPPELLRWYQFRGNLRDSTAASSDEQSLTSINRKAPLWATVGQSYGLSVEPDNSYSLSPLTFFHKEEDQGGGLFLLHMKPMSSGIILNAFFPAQLSSSEGAWITITREKNALILRLSAGNNAIEIPAYFASLEPAYTPVLVEFYIHPYRMEAKYIVGGNYLRQYKTISVDLPGPLTGESSIRLGSAPANFRMDSPAIQVTELAFTETVQDVISPNSTEIFETEIIRNSEENIPATVWNEFAILLSGLPLLREEVPVIGQSDLIYEEEVFVAPTPPQQTNQ